jgi:hypothetical protein
MKTMGKKWEGRLKTKKMPFLLLNLALLGLIKNNNFGTFEKTV